MIIVLLGPDSFRKRERIQVLRDAFVKKFSAPDSAVSDLSGDEATIQQIQLALAGGDLFSTKKFVVLRSILGLAEADQAMLLELLQKISDDVICLLAVDSFPAKKSELKTFLETVDKTEQFSALTVFEATETIQRLCQKHGVHIDQTTARLLADAFHTDTWQLHLQTKALCFQVKNDAEPIITKDHALAILPEESQENFFGLTDAITAHNQHLTLGLVHKHLSEGAAIQLITTIIFKHLTLLRIFAQQPNANLKGVHSFVQQKAQAGAKHYTADQLATTMDDLIQLDVDSKSGKLPDPESRLLLILANLTTKKPA